LKAAGWLLPFVILSLSAEAYAAASPAGALQALSLDPDNDDSDVHVVEANWNGRPLLFIDYLKDDGGDLRDGERHRDRRLVAMEETPGGTYRKIDITTGEEEGAFADIVAIGFANADNDTAQELIVLLGWQQQHATVYGTLYEVRIYDDLGSSSHSKPRYMKTISEHFDARSCDCSWDDGRSNRYPFKTITAIKRELKTLAINRPAKRPSLH
jgi:hypothetical protein